MAYDDETVLEAKRLIVQKGKTATQASDVMGGEPAASTIRTWIKGGRLADKPWDELRTEYAQSLMTDTSPAAMAREMHRDLMQLMEEMPAGSKKADAVAKYEELVAERLNARDVVVVEPGEAWGELAYSAEADMSVLGPAFGEDAGRVMDALNDARVDDPSMETLEAAVEDALNEPVDLTDEMVAFRRETPPGVANTEFEALEGGGVVYVDTELTEDIESEGYAHEVIRRVQEMRKDLDLAMDAEIRLECEVADDRVADLVADHENLVAEEVRAGEVGDVSDGLRETWAVEDTEVEIAIERLATPEASD